MMPYQSDSPPTNPISSGSIYSLLWNRKGFVSSILVPLSHPSHYHHGLQTPQNLTDHLDHILNAFKASCLMEFPLNYTQFQWIMGGCKLITYLIAMISAS